MHGVCTRTHESLRKRSEFRLTNLTAQRAPLFSLGAFEILPLTRRPKLCGYLCQADL